MKLHLLLTTDIALTKPKTCKIIMNFGWLVVRFGDNTEKEGIHCVVEDETDNIVGWLKQYDGIVKGNGNPITEQFEIVHIKDNLK